MATSTVFSDVSARSLLDIASIVTRASAGSTSPMAARSAHGDDTASVSRSASVLDRLQALRATDPAKFRAVMAQIAETLQAEAKSSEDPPERAMLGDLSSRFATAAREGDASSLVPPRSARDVHATAAKGAHETSPRAAPEGDPADANHDGVVSWKERETHRAAATGGHEYKRGPADLREPRMAATMQRVLSMVEDATGSSGVP